jgi:hypothetical protein
VDLPPRTYIHGSGTLVYARGSRDSLKILRAANRDITIEGINMDLANAPRGSSFGVTIQRGAKTVLLSGVAIRANPHRGGVQITGGSDITIQGCQILDMKQKGITLYGDGQGEGPYQVLIGACHITSEIQPVDCEPVDGALCRDVTIERSHLVSLSDNYALTLYRSKSARIRHCTLRGSVFMTDAVDATLEACVVDSTHSVGHDAIEAFGMSANCDIIGNEIKTATNRTGVHAARRRWAAPHHINIRGNVIRANGPSGTGVTVEDVAHAKVVGNRIVGQGTTAIDISVSSRAVERTTVVHGNTSEGFFWPLRMRRR